MENGLIDSTVWQARWQGLKQTMDYWLETKAENDSSYARQETLMSLLASLRAFGKSQKDFFLHGLEEKPQYRLEPSSEYPWEYLFRTTIDQIGFDLDAILRACQQRMSAKMAPALGETLDLADRLAYAALQPALAAGLIDPNTTVVTYFQKAVNVRLVPYAPIALIGIPFSAVQSPRDLLAIPHEVGHYVFRNGRVRSGRFADSRFATALSTMFADEPNWCNAWLEEIFADVYGCLVAGPVIAHSFIELVTDDPIADFTAEDDEHPIAAVRPQIYFHTLQRMGGYDGALQKLTTLWAGLFEQRGAPTELQVPGNEWVAPIFTPLDEVVETMATTIIGTICEPQFLGTLIPQDGAAKTQRWSEELTADDTLTALHTAFEKYSTALMQQPNRVPELKVLSDASMQAHVDGEPVTSDGKTQKLGATGLWIDAIKAAAATSALEGGPVFAVPSEIWTVLLDAGGWATEGPGGGNAH